MLNTFFVVSCEQCGQQLDRLSIVLTIDCDIYGRSFERTIIQPGRNTASRKRLLSDLESKAECCGWLVYHSMHHCDSCVLDTMFAEFEHDHNAAAGPTRASCIAT